MNLVDKLSIRFESRTVRDRQKDKFKTIMNLQKMKISKHSRNAIKDWLNSKTGLNKLYF